VHASAEVTVVLLGSAIPDVKDLLKKLFPAMLERMEKHLYPDAFKKPNTTTPEVI
jgi:hypothetical protein